jgi:hypothetical protein
MIQEPCSWYFFTDMENEPHYKAKAIAEAKEAGVGEPATLTKKATLGDGIKGWMVIAGKRKRDHAR